MGNCSSGTAEERAADRAISKQNKKDEYSEYNKIKMLLLGPGESGKSAMFKQIKLLHGAPLTHEDLSFWKQVVHANVVQCMQTVCEASHVMGIEIEAQKELALMEAMDSRLPLSGPVEEGSQRTRGDVIKTLWKDEGIQKVWERRSEIQVVDSHRAFLNDIDRLSAPDYQPTPQDTVLARIRTTGITSDFFVIGGKTFALYDVGGQRSERRKWIHVFDNVHAIIFVVGLSEYNQLCFEDSAMNRIEEGLKVFEWISSHELFVRTPIILFLNKADLFAEKIKVHPIAEVPAWSDYTGGSDYNMAWHYFFKKFVALQDSVNPEKTIYAHVTNATDPSNVQVVFNAATDVILRSNLYSSGLA